MRSAVVFGARQQYGFEVCAKLLDLGCYVYAVDHANWQTEECEDRWMQIGRNAHVELMLINQQQSVKDQPRVMEQAECYIIPILDYTNHKYDRSHEQLLRMLDMYVPWESSKKFIFLHGFKSNMNHHTLHKKVESFVRNVGKNNHQVKEYYLPPAEMQGYIYLQTNNKQDVEKIICDSITDFPDVILEDVGM